MSLGIVIKGPEGLVLAADSRVTIQAQPPEGPPISVNFDNATKLLTFSRPNSSVGAVTYGQAAIQIRTAHSFIPEFEADIPEERLPIDDFSRRLSDFFLNQWRETMPEEYEGPEMTFVVGGYDEGEPHGRVFLFDIPRNPDPREQTPAGTFGITWGGQREFVDRLIRGYDSRLPGMLQESLDIEPDRINQALTGLTMAVPIQTMPLQDCVDLALFFIRTTVSGQALTIGIRGTGGPIDVATITRGQGLKFVQRKQISGEMGIPGSEGEKGGD